MFNTYNVSQNLGSASDFGIYPNPAAPPQQQDIHDLDAPTYSQQPGT